MCGERERAERGLAQSHGLHQGGSSICLQTAGTEVGVERAPELGLTAQASSTVQSKDPRKRGQIPLLERSPALRGLTPSNSLAHPPICSSTLHRSAQGALPSLHHAVSAAQPEGTSRSPHPPRTILSLLWLTSVKAHAPSSSDARSAFPKPPSAPAAAVASPLTAPPLLKPLPVPSLCRTRAPRAGPLGRHNARWGDFLYAARQRSC